MAGSPEATTSLEPEILAALEREALAASRGWKPSMVLMQSQGMLEKIVDGVLYQLTRTIELYIERRKR